MRISDKTLELVLGRAKLVTPEQLITLSEEAARSKRTLLEVVTDQRIVTEKVLIRAFSEYSGIPYIEVDPTTVPSDVLKRIPERVARQYMAALFKVDSEGEIGRAHV